MSELFSHQYLDVRHFAKNSLEGLCLQKYYENCRYLMHIQLFENHSFDSMAIETLHGDDKKSLRILFDTKDHTHKDRKGMGAFLSLLASKLKFDVLNGLDADNAGFLHSSEIINLHAKGITRVPPTIYRGISKLLRQSLKAPNSPEAIFLRKFLFEPHQFWHLVNWHGRIGADKEESDMLWWANIPHGNIYFYGKNGDIIADEEILKACLKNIFPKRCLLSKKRVEAFFARHIEEILDVTQNKATDGLDSDDKGREEPEPSREPETLIVDISQKDAFSSISDAIDAALPGDTILLKPGDYNEAIILDKPLDIIGDGKREEIVVSFSNYFVALVRTPKGSIKNLTLKQLGGKDMPCVNIRDGGCEIESCEISSVESNGIDISGNAAPKITGCYIHHSQAGISIKEGGNPTIEENRICNTSLSGIIASGMSNPTIRKNEICESMQGGIYLFENSTALILENNIHNNTYSGIAVTGGSKPIIKSNIISKNGHFGIEIFKKGGGVIGANNLSDNKVKNINVSPDSERFVEFVKND